MTSNNNFLSEVFEDNDKDVSVKTKQFLKKNWMLSQQIFQENKDETN